MFSREQIDQVRASVDIIETIREYVPSLKVAGRSVKGLCPFHGERTPSFHVQPEKGLYKCFGCGEGGDVFAFLSKVENLTFSEAIERLAARAGITLRQERNRDDRQEGTRERVLRVLEAAAAYYEEKLWSDRGGEAALAYLAERHVQEDTSRAFRLGYAPSTGDPAFEALVKKGFPIELCQQAGLASRSNAGRFYDPLYGRLIFPILDTFGNVVGFGGRILPKTTKSVLDIGKEQTDEGPKYINSPETPVFSKGKLMYGLYQAKGRIRDEKRAMVLEGYMDVIGAHQAGFTFGVATLGTALTRDHAKLIKRYADEVLMFFDADVAGRKAAVKGLEPVLQEELFPRVVLTEETGDPDEIVHEKGQAFFSHLLESSPDFMEYLLRVSRGIENTLQEKAALAKHLLQLIAASPNEILKAEWTRRLGLGLGIDIQVLEKELKTAASKTRETPKPAVQMAKTFLPSAEEEYLQLLLNVPYTGSETRLTVDDFTDERFRRLMILLDKQIKENGRVVVADLFNEVSPEDKEWFLKLAMEDKTFDEPEERREQLAKDIRLRKVKQRFSDLGDRIKVGQGSSTEVAEFQELFRQIKGKVQ